MSKCCKNCVHGDVCRIRTYPSQYGLTGDGCDHHKDKSLCVELPCKVGDEVYYIGGIAKNIIKPLRIEKIYIGESGFDFRVCTQNLIYFDVDGEEIFYTKEQAQDKLKEAGNET